MERAWKENRWPQQSGGHRFLRPREPPLLFHSSLRNVSLSLQGLAGLLLRGCGADPASTEAPHCSTSHRWTGKGCRTGAVRNCTGHRVSAGRGSTEQLPHLTAELRKLQESSSSSSSSVRALCAAVQRYCHPEARVYRALGFCKRSLFKNSGSGRRRRTGGRWLCQPAFLLSTDQYHRTRTERKESVSLQVRSLRVNGTRYRTAVGRPSRHTELFRLTMSF